MVAFTVDSRIWKSLHADVKELADPTKEHKGADSKVNKAAIRDNCRVSSVSRGVCTDSHSNVQGIGVFHLQIGLNLRQLYKYMTKTTPLMETVRAR